VHYGRLRTLTLQSLISPLQADRSEETDGLAHGGLNVQRLDVLPVLLQQRDEEVDAQHHVTQDLVVSHLDVADGNAEAQHLLELELDRRADLGELG